MMKKLIYGELKYLAPINYLDPNFWGIGGSQDIETATHGIYVDTVLTPTNQ